MRTFKQLLLSTIFILPSVISAHSAHAEVGSQTPHSTVPNTSLITSNRSANVASSAVQTPISESNLPAPPPEVTPITEINLYQVELADISNSNSVALNETQLVQLSEAGMKKLLVRLTGKSVLLDSPRTEFLLSNARNWLRTYSYVPIVQEGVQVGQKLRLKFDEMAIKAALAQAQIKIWPLNLRPELLLMGTLIENGSVTKLDQETLQYRIDVNLRYLFADMALRVQTPQSSTPWIYPMNPANNIGALQDLLVQSDLDKLLSYKLVKRDDSYELSW